MKPAFDFRLIHPDGPISRYIQAMWLATVSPDTSTITKPLFSDGACGVFFNLSAPVYFKGKPCGKGAFWMPVKHQAEFIDLTPGCLLVGFRFHAGVSPSVLMPLRSAFFESYSPSRSEHMQTDGFPLPLMDIFQLLSQEIQRSEGREVQIEGAPLEKSDDLFSVLQAWLLKNLDTLERDCVHLSHAVSAIDPHVEIQSLHQVTALSLRQLERKFKDRIGMTPKYYQRLMRIRAAIEKIKQNPATSLADLAIDVGYSDQAHMTREFRTLAKMTPKQYQLRKIQE